STFWTVAGANTSSNQLWVTGATAQTQQSNSVQSTIASHIAAVGGAGIGGANAGDASAFDFSQTAGNYLIPTSNRWQNLPAIAGIAVPSTSATLNLYSLLPGTGGAGSSTELGYFTLTDTSGNFSLTYTAFTAIPEPSTYAAILGALTVGFVLVRRRFGASRLSAVA